MKPLTFEKFKVIEKLKENRKKHVANYESAKIKFKERAEEQAKAIVESVRSFDFSDDLTLKKTIDLPIPVSYEEEYDRAIMALEMCKDTEIVMGNDDVQRYLMDKWEWRRNFESVTNSYLKGH